MTLSDWERVIAELETYRMNTGISTTVTVWGGEPLVSSYFDEIITALHHKSFKTEIITNGVLIDEHLKTIQNCVDRVYVSLDGTRKVHNSIRGEGVFEKVTENLKKLKHNNVTVMSVITPQLINGLDEFLTELDSIGIKQLYLQDMIYYSKEPSLPQIRLRVISSKCPWSAPFFFSARILLYICLIYLSTKNLDFRQIIFYI
jgi:sulfatase maturation enzyme AslB (radical SAM superfamily)